MVRSGCGRYPALPIFNLIVDGLNPVLGARLWQLTDWYVDYNRHGVARHSTNLFLYHRPVWRCQEKLISDVSFMSLPE